jgi:N-acetylneuraminic acid mutarotase
MACGAEDSARMAPIVDRVREWIWANPGRARMAVAGAALTAVAAGAFVAVRPDGDSSGRQRHRQYAGATEADTGFEGDQLDVPSESTVPSGDAAGGAPAGSAGTGTTSAGAPAPGGTSGTGTTNPAAGVDGAGSSTSTNSGGVGTTEPPPGTGTTKTTGPAGGSRNGTPVTATADAPGWGLLPKAPIGPRGEHAAVWTGREMVIWGGRSDYEGDPFTDGAAYDPAARTWRKLPGAPITPRTGANVDWTGKQMLVFGGTSADGDILADGALWDPATNTWRGIPASPLGPRDGSVVAWAGDRLVIWSGNTVLGPDAPDADSSGDTPEPPGAPEVRNDGAAYVPATDSWVPVGPAPIPPRSGAQAAWTGSRLVVSGGQGADDDRTDGATLDPVSGAWSTIATRPEPGSCGGDTACGGLWTGTAVLFPASGLAYDPAADRWSVLAAPPGSDAPAPGEPAVWTGRRLLAWGVPGLDDDAGAGSGDAGDGPAPAAAAMYDPVANRWQPFPVGPLRGRDRHTAVWTGEATLIWGGFEDDQQPLGDGAAYRPE